MVSKKLISGVLAALLLFSIAWSTVAFAQTRVSTATANPAQTLFQTAANNTNLTISTVFCKNHNGFHTKQREEETWDCLRAKRA
jgi:uncharacterized protein (UPF0333 family)